MATAIGSGLDLPKLVRDLVDNAREKPAELIKKAENVATVKLSSVGQVKQSLNTLKTALEALSKRADKPALAARVSADAGFTVTGTENAVPGLYNVKVESIASAHKITSAGGAVPGPGTLDIIGGGNTVSVTIAAGDTLADVARSINLAADSKTVIASVVKSDSGEHLVLSARELGTDNALTLGGTSTIFATKTEIAAKDAKVVVDGLERTLKGGNSVGDLIPGVNLTLTQAKSQEFTVEVKTDEAALKADLDAFVKAWNEANAVLKRTSAYDPSASPERRASPLTGDSMVRGLQQQLRGQISNNLIELRSLGVSIDKDGVMKVDEGEFKNAALADVKAVFGTQGQYPSTLKTMLDGQLNSVDGIVTLREQALNKQISSYKDQLAALDQRMQRLSDRYTAQFAAMERMIVQMQSGASALDNLLAGLQR